MKKSIKFNLLANFTLALIIVLTFGVIINNTYMENHYIKRDKTRLEGIAKDVAIAIDSKDIDLIDDIEYDAKVSITVVDTHLTPIFARRPLIQEAHREIRNAEVFPIYTLLDVQDPVLIYVEEFVGGYIFISTPLVIIQNSLQITNEFHVITAILAVLIGSLFTIIFSRNFTQPIIEISKIAQSMSKLDFSKKIEYKSENELGTLAYSINSLSDSLEKNINQLQDEVEFQKVLSRNVSHELKTPVAVIKGYVEGVYYGIAETEEEKEQYYKIIINECDRMNTLIGEMLAFSKISATKFTLSDLSELKTFDIKEEILTIFNDTMERKEIKFVQNVEDFTFWGDNGTIVRVITNFLSNAIKYGDNKEIRLSITKEEMQENENIIISVFNTGDKIETGYLSRIFDAFYTLDEARTRERNGHGLGLSIVKSISDLYIGKVTVKNRPNGVEFKFIFQANFKEYIT